MTLNTDEILKYPEPSDGAIKAIDNLIAQYNASAAAQPSEDLMAAGGAVRIARPAPTVEAPPPPPDPVIELGPEWAPYAEHITTAQALAQQSGFSSFY